MDYFRNLMLASLAKADLEILRPHLETVELTLGQIIFHPGSDIDYVYFPYSGIVSVIVATPDNRRLEVGIYGRDGIGGTPILLNATRIPYLHLTQQAGSAGRISAETMRTLLVQSPTLLASLLKHVQVFSVQVAYTALANGSFVIEERLARWLLMCRDRLDTNILTLTHEFLSMMLAVRRSGVTEAIHSLEGRGLIRASRGRVEILDRARLVEMAGQSYGAPEREHTALIGPWLDH